MDYQRTKTRAVRIFIALAILLAVQLIWAALAGSWINRLNDDVPRGYYAGLSGGSWYVLHLGETWPDGHGAGSTEFRFHHAGISIFRLGGYISIICIRVEWTIGATLLLEMIPLHMAWRCYRYRRRSRNPEICWECGYDLRASPDQCPECGTVISDRQKRNRWEAEAAMIPPPS